MNDAEIEECIDEIEMVIEDPSLIEKHGFTFEEFLSVNEFKIIVLCFYYFKQYPVNQRLLKLSLNAVECDNYDYIYGLVSKKWVECAKNEITQYIKELETT